MSLIISNIVLHQIVFDGSNIQMLARPDCIEVSPGVEGFVEDVHRIYNAKAGKGYAAFAEEASEFETKMQAMLDGSSEFYPFSLFTAEKLVEEIAKYEFEEQGYLLVARYQALATEFLMVAMLGTKEHISVNKELNLSQANHLDLNKIQLALRIDLSEYGVNRNEGRYVSFIKGRAGRKVADFFLDFVGCTETINAKEQSQSLVKAVEDYMDVEQFSPEEKTNSRKGLLEFVKDQSDSGRDIELKEVAEQITPASSESSFYDFSQQGGYELEESFPGDKTGFKGMTKFSGQGGGVSMNFDKALLGNRVIFNEHADTLTIHQVPPNLKQQLLKYLNKDNSEF